MGKNGIITCHEYQKNTSRDQLESTVIPFQVIRNLLYQEQQENVVPSNGGENFTINSRKNISGIVGKCVPRTSI
jgi:hypothetical protein